MRGSGTVTTAPLDVPVLAAPAEIAFDRELCGDLATSGRREWLVTNGLGGRTVLVARLDETIDYDGTAYALATARARASLRVYGDRDAAHAIVMTAGRQLTGAGLGTLAEIADGTPIEGSSG